MKRIILTTSGFGKTYLDNICSNIYDFDKHTLGCKYCRELYQSISDEEFKGMPNRVLNKEFPFNLFCKFNNFIESEINNYDIILCWGSTLYKDFLISNSYINSLQENKITKEIITYELHGEDIKILNKRFKERGNIYYKYLKEEDINRVANKIRNNEYNGLLCWILKKPFYLKDFLILTGSKLVINNKIYGIKEYLDEYNLKYSEEDLIILEEQLKLDNFINNKLNIKTIKNKDLYEFLKYRLENIEFIKI